MAVDGLEASPTHQSSRETQTVGSYAHAIVRGGDVPQVIPTTPKCGAGLAIRGAGLRGCLIGFGDRQGRGLTRCQAQFTVQQFVTGTGNLAGAQLLQKNLTWLGPIKYTQEEQAFARAIQKATGTAEKGLDGEIRPLEEPRPDPPGGSTDVGDVSWLVPTLHLSVTTAPPSIWHAWPVVACGGMSIGHKGLVYASKTLAATMVDLFEDAKLRESIQAEFREKARGFVYKPYIPGGPPPVPVSR